MIGFLYLEYDPFSHFVVYLGGKKYLDFLGQSLVLSKFQALLFETIL